MAPSSEGALFYMIYQQKTGAGKNPCPCGVYAMFCSGGLTYLDQLLVLVFQLPSSSDQVHLPEEPLALLK